MLRQEAEWLSERLFSGPPAETFPLLDVGSSSLSFRTQEQPYIEACIQLPARERGLPIVTLDAKEDLGVDIVGDFIDPITQAKVRDRSIKSILCANLLEHVENPQAVATAISSLLPPGGYAFVTVPHEFFHHPDPIDTMFRPDLTELRRMFPELEFVDGQILKCGRFFRHIKGGTRQAAWKTVRRVMPFYRRRRYQAVVREWRNLVGPTSVTCAVFRRPTSS